MSYLEGASGRVGNDGRNDRASSETLQPGSSNASRYYCLVVCFFLMFCAWCVCTHQAQNINSEPRGLKDLGSESGGKKEREGEMIKVG